MIDNESYVGAYAQCISHKNASPLTYKGTNSWILAAPGSKQALVIDPGPPDDACVQHLERACATRGLSVAAIVLTHDHYDHAGSALRAAQVFGAPILSFGLGTLEPGQLYLEGITMPLVVLALPGHSSDSLALVVPDAHLAFTGDMLFAQSSTMICWPDGRLQDYMESLDTLAQAVQTYEVKALLTGHGPVIQNPVERIEQARRHRQQRLNQLISAVRSGIPAEASALVEATYNDIAPELRNYAERSVKAQLQYAFEQGLLKK
jgi:glyoxylase-like metal-dependent hydrolase (beta-lactamase superfamily II)